MNDVTAAQTPAKQPQLILQKLYLKDISFETPMGIKAFQSGWKPQFSQQLQTRHAKIDDASYEIVLTATLSAMLGEADKKETAFIVEVQQAGLFKLNPSDANIEKQLINVACPTILFPYVRETVDSLLVKAGFPAVSMPPVNFDALYQRALQEQATPATAH